MAAPKRPSMEYDRLLFTARNLVRRTQAEPTHAEIMVERLLEVIDSLQHEADLLATTCENYRARFRSLREP